ncbi:MFS transporter [Vallitalea pronyensis]|uniref:MFS transporter n=1 Tax=Vallitalea pronyensis TaxID=1348613 RepID=A0A8J8SHJ4_9FIRM|nr:MFS transporter [Vallitalea pronyensis]QUI23458.1 MFS transporter [Vallitalea pronyensis]
MTQVMTNNKLPLSVKLLYACGNLGIGIITVLQSMFLVYFFTAPEVDGQPLIPYLIPQGSIFLGMTLLGIILALGSVFDAVLDPIIARFSDKFEHASGKRIPIMRMAVIPFVLTFTLVFFAPVPKISFLNVIWLTIIFLLSKVFYTMYMIPFYSLLVDLAKSGDDKADLGTINSAFWFVGFLIASFSSALWGFLGDTFHMTLLTSFRTTIVIFSLLGLVAAIIPAFLIHEQKYVITSIKSTNEKVLPALKHVLKNKNFQFYLLTNLAYTMSSKIFETGLIYYVTVLALQDASINGLLITIIGVATLLCYPLINRLAKTKGRKVVLKVGLILLVLSYIVISLLGVGNIHPYFLFALIIILLPFANAGFGILPHVITSDCAQYDREMTGKDHAGMYMAANGFVVKIGGSIAIIIFTSLLLLGKDVGNDLGIRVAILFAGTILIAAYFLLKKYNEKEIMSYQNKQDVA